MRKAKGELEEGLVPSYRLLAARGEPSTHQGGDWVAAAPLGEVLLPMPFIHVVTAMIFST